MRSCAARYAAMISARVRVACGLILPGRTCGASLEVRATPRTCRPGIPALADPAAASHALRGRRQTALDCAAVDGRWRRRDDRGRAPRSSGCRRPAARKNPSSESAADSSSAALSAAFMASISRCRSSGSVGMTVRFRDDWWSAPDSRAPQGCSLWTRNYTPIIDLSPVRAARHVIGSERRGWTTSARTSATPSAG